jgi:hypothetical protein
MNLLVLAVASYATRIALVSDDTPSTSGLSAFIATLTGAHCIVETFGADIESAILFAPDLVIDYSDSLFQAQAHAREATPAAAYAYSNPDFKLAVSAARRLKPSASSVFSNAVFVATHFNWAKVIGIYTGPFYETGEGNVEFEKFSVGEGADKAAIDFLVARSIRLKGTRPIFIMTNQRITNLILSSLVKYDMTAGYAIVVIGNDCQSDVNLIPTGVMCVVLSGAETASVEEIEYWYIYYSLMNWLSTAGPS